MTIDGTQAKPPPAMEGEGVKIPKWLHELHGEQSNWRDIGTVHLLAWASAVYVFLLVGGWAGALLAFLMVDIAGGVVANVTRGTNDHYATRPRHRIVFLCLHMVQPALLILLLPVSAPVVAAVAIWTLLGAGLLECLRRQGHERTLSAPIATAWAVAGISVLVTSGGAAAMMPETQVDAEPMTRGVDLLLILYMLKLLPAFSVDWHGHDEVK